MTIREIGFRLCIATFSLGASIQALAAPLSFAPGHIYTTQFFSTNINEHSVDGRFLTTVSIQGLEQGEETKGIAFGPDGNLYVVLDKLFTSARLVSVDENGAISESYALPGSTGGNLSYGKLEFTDDGKVYVGTGAGIVRVQLGDPGSAQLLGAQTLDAFDVAALPGGNLLMISSYSLDEIDSDGNLVRTITLSDPNRVSDAQFFFVNDLRGLEYDPDTDRVFVSMLGNSDNLFFVTMAFDLATGILLDIGNFTYGDDMFLAGDTLLLGSRTEAPWILSPVDLSILGRLDGAERMFVTRNVHALVAEPGMLALMTASLLLMLAMLSARARTVRRRALTQAARVEPSSVLPASSERVPFPDTH